MLLSPAVLSGLTDKITLKVTNLKDEDVWIETCMLLGVMSKLVMFNIISLDEPNHREDELKDESFPPNT